MSNQTLNPQEDPLEDTQPVHTEDVNQHYQPIRIGSVPVQPENSETRPIPAVPYYPQPSNQPQRQRFDIPQPPIQPQPQRQRFDNPPPYIPVNPPSQPRVYQTAVKPTAQTRPPQMAPVTPKKAKKRWSCGGCGCLTILAAGLALLLLYFLAPLRTNILILGIDRAADGSYTGRSDTNIVVSVIPLKPTVYMLSIPRDLWVSIPGVGENRINTAHFFAEAAEPGSGPRATLETVRQNFGLSIPYYARIKFDSVLNIVDAMGGVTITLDTATAGYDPGTYTLNSEQALAFARNRTGTDDFFRMEQGQILIKAMIKQMLSPVSWVRLPAIYTTFLEAVDTNLPAWQWPRIGLALVRAATTNNIDNRTLNREMVTSWVTDQGAQVLLPNWDAINPVLKEMFGQ